MLDEIEVNFITPLQSLGFILFDQYYLKAFKNQESYLKFCVVAYFCIF